MKGILRAVDLLGPFGRSSHAVARDADRRSEDRDSLLDLLDPVALRGRLVEISASVDSGALTPAIELLKTIQRFDEPAAWVTRAGTLFYPPDALASGVDLARLAVITVSDALAVARAADRLVSSGAFSLVIADLGPNPVIPIPLQGRILRATERHSAITLLLTEKSVEAASIGSLVSLRLHAARSKEEWRVELVVIKDKRRAPGRIREEVFRAPDGLVL